MNNIDCKLCFQSKVQPFFYVKEKSFGHLRDWEYFSCTNCGLIAMNSEQHLSVEEEKSRYEQHENFAEDPGYVEHLMRLWSPLKKMLNQGGRGLDYGSGPNPVLAKIVKEQGLSMEIYDPIFAPTLSVEKDNYDFIVCNEVAEHFYKPGEEFEKMNDRLVRGGLMAVGTKPYEESIDFQSWPYRRDDTHVCFYTEPTFRWLEHKFNWQLLDKGADWRIWRKL